MPTSSNLVWKTRLFAAIVVLTNVTGNFALSWGIKHGAAMDGSLWSFVKVVFDPWVFCGILLLSGWVLSRMALLSWADLSDAQAGLVMAAIRDRVDAMAGNKRKAAESLGIDRSTIYARLKDDA